MPTNQPDSKQPPRSQDDVTLAKAVRKGTLFRRGKAAPAGAKQPPLGRLAPQPGTPAPPTKAEPTGRPAADAQPGWPSAPKPLPAAGSPPASAADAPVRHAPPDPPLAPRAAPPPAPFARPVLPLPAASAAPGPVATVPPVAPGFREVELTPIIPERAWIRILENQSDRSYLYEVIEPPLAKDEATVLQFIRETLVRTLDGRKAVQQRSDWGDVLLAAARQAVLDHAIRLDAVQLQRVEYHLLRDFLGYGPIDVLLRDGMIEDISCDGPGIPLYLFHRKYESLRTSVVFASETDLDAFVVRLAQRSGKHISVAAPLLDATLPDGSRLQATLSREVTTRGSSFTIRKFRADPLSPPDLIRYGTLSPELAAYFWFVMEMGASFLLAGGTASGKTTSLNAISQFIPPEKKIVSIEDTREINLVHENWIAGLTRTGFGADSETGRSVGSIDMYKLLESALRQRPEYLIVGEVRGPEALTLFQAMATGHAVYSTMHADSVQSAVYRLENEPINIPRIMIQTMDLMGIQAQVRINGQLKRRLTNVTEIVGFDPDTRELLTNTVFEWDVKKDRHNYLGRSYILERIQESRNLSEAVLKQEWRNRTQVLEWMGRQGIRHYAEVAKAVNAYYRDPKAFLASIQGE